MDIKQITIVFIVAFIFGVVGSEIGYKFKKLSRQIYERAALNLFIGFASAILSLIIISRFNAYPVAISVLVGVLYGYFMSNTMALKFTKNT